MYCRLVSKMTLLINGILLFLYWPTRFSVQPKKASWSGRSGAHSFCIACSRFWSGKQYVKLVADHVLHEAAVVLSGRRELLGALLEVSAFQVSAMQVRLRHGQPLA